MTDIGPLQVRRGADADFDGFTPANGEPILNTTTNELIVGDGSTEGGMNAAGPENIRRLRSVPFGLQQRYPTVTKLIDLGWWFDPDDGNQGTGFSTKQGFSLTSQIVSDPWEAFAVGLVPAGSFVSGSWIDVYITAFVHAHDGSTNIAPRFGMIWDFDGTQVSQATHASGNWHAIAYHDGVSEDQWVANDLYQLHWRIQAMGYTEQVVTVERARLWNSAGGVQGDSATWTSAFEGRTFRNTIDMSVDRELYLAASLNGPISHPANDLRIRSACAYMYGWTGGVQTDLTGKTS